MSARFRGGKRPHHWSQRQRTTAENLHEIIYNDVSDLSAIQGRLSGYDACFFCLGVSAVEMNEEAYRCVTYDLTISAAGALAKLDPGVTFIYVSGANSDSTEGLKLRAGSFIQPRVIQAVHRCRRPKAGV
jgi:hypothetical protein